MKMCKAKKPAGDSQSGPAQSTAGPQEVVGYGKPPIKTQFKKGISGNPKGRRAGSRNVASAIKDAFIAPITIRQGEKTHNVSTLEALARKQLEQGLKGDHRAILAILKTAKELGLLEQPKAPEFDLRKLTDDELEQLDRLYKKMSTKPQDSAA
jgi:hypothetical protein